jgi:hypothetical protein
VRTLSWAISEGKNRFSDLESTRKGSYAASGLRTQAQEIPRSQFAVVPSSRLRVVTRAGRVSEPSDALSVVLSDSLVPSKGQSRRWATGGSAFEARRADRLPAKPAASKTTVVREVKLVTTGPLSLDINTHSCQTPGTMNVRTGILLFT